MIGGWWRRLLETKFLVILGTVSYALYLTHTLAIELAVRTGEPNTLWTALVALINSVLLMAPFAALVHVFLERPYMFDKIASSPRETPKQPIQSKSVMTYLKTWWQTPQLVMIVALIGVGGLIWQSNRVPVTLLAPIAEHHRPDFARQTLLDHVNPVRFEFTASHDALGMILLHIRPLSESEQQALGARRTGGETLAALRVTIRLGEQVIQQSEYPLYQIYQARFFMIGLPVQPESGGKTYDVELSITDPLANKSLALINEETLLRSVYFPNKAEYFRRPQALIQLITSKLVQPFTTHAGQLQLALTLPLLALLWFATWSGK